MIFPGGRRFAFTIIDDTDSATVENVKPFYDLLRACGMRTTKTVWPLPCPEGSVLFRGSETLADPDYRQFVLDLQRDGFEVAFHGATMESSPRPRTQRALDIFTDTFGILPRVYANHSRNRENLYWGDRRVDDAAMRRLYRWLSGERENPFRGEVEGSEYFWGDLCHDRVEYVRNLTFSRVNLLTINPSLPYTDPERPYVRWWFSANDADDFGAFERLLRPSQQEQLEREGGVCIVSTHLAKGFVKNGTVREPVRRLIEALAARPGWFVPVGELLDWLRGQREYPHLPPAEWRRMQRQWFRDLVGRHVRARLEALAWRARQGLPAPMR